MIPHGLVQGRCFMSFCMPLHAFYILLHACCMLLHIVACNLQLAACSLHVSNASCMIPHALHVFYMFCMHPACICLPFACFPHVCILHAFACILHTFAYNIAHFCILLDVFCMFSACDSHVYMHAACFYMQFTNLRIPFACVLHVLYMLLHACCTDKDLRNPPIYWKTN